VRLNVRLRPTRICQRWLLHEFGYHHMLQEYVVAILPKKKYINVCVYIYIKDIIHFEKLYIQIWNSMLVLELLC